MRILFVHKERLTSEQKIFVQQLMHAFTKCGFHIIDAIPSIAKCDCILLYETYMLDAVIKQNKIYNLPIVCCLRNSDVAANYNKLNAEKIDFFFLFEDRAKNNIFPFQKLSSSFFMPFDCEYKVTNAMKGIPKSVYVNIGETASLEMTLQLVRLFNQLTSWNIIFQTKYKQLSSVFNGNIKIVNNKEDIQLLIQQSDVVAGTGYAALYAILCNKPCIVVGEKGYGGLISKDNLKEQYRSFFQGRIGGRYMEMLPNNLIVEDLRTTDVDNYDGICGLLFQFSEQLQNDLKQALNELVRLRKMVDNQFMSIVLVFNSDFTVFKGNDRYWIMNRYNKQMKGWINEVQYRTAIEWFIGPNKIPDTLRKEDLVLVREFIRNKILIPYI